jgi:isoquinoline 1-oxidoreductase
VIAEPSPSGGIAGLRVARVVEAFECGAVINPEHLRSTIEGAIVQGLGGALYESVEFADGRVLNPRFSQYRVPRFGDVPPIETVLLDRKDLPSAGAGETPIVGIAPAIANALYHATGLRRRSMPLLGPAQAR